MTVKVTITKRGNFAVAIITTQISWLNSGNYSIVTIGTFVRDGVVATHAITFSFAIWLGMSNGEEGDNQEDGKFHLGRKEF